MKNNRIKEEFLAMEIPEMKTGILAEIRQKKAIPPRRRMRPAAIAVIAAMLALFGITVGAGTSGMLNLQNGGKYYIQGSDGIVIKPTGFHLEEDVDVPLSEKALANIAPYVWSPAEDERLEFETSSLEEMEEFIDMPLILPKSVESKAIRYRLNAAGSDDIPVSLHIQVITEESYDTLYIYLRSFPGVVATASEPEMEEYTLSDGTPVSIAVAERRNGGLRAHALYRKNDAVYFLRVDADSKHELMENVKAVLDTVE